MTSKQQMVKTANLLRSILEPVIDIVLDDETEAKLVSSLETVHDYATVLSDDVLVTIKTLTEAIKARRGDD